MAQLTHIEVPMTTEGAGPTRHDRVAYMRARNAEIRSGLHPQGRAAILVCAARGRAKKQGLEFDLDIPWVAAKVAAGVCEATGIPFDYARSTLGQGPTRSWTPSLDRIDNTKGYTRDNVKVVCWAYNRAKGVDDHAAVVRLARAVIAKEAA